MAEFVIEPVISKQMNGRMISLDELDSGAYLEIKTLHHTYVLVIKDPKDSEVILVGNSGGHAVPKVYRLDGSFSELEDFIFLPRVLREGFQVEFNRNDSILQISFVVSLEKRRRIIYSWILKKSLEQNFIGRVCSRLVRNRFFIGRFFLTKNSEDSEFFVSVRNRFNLYCSHFILLLAFSKLLFT